MHFIKLTNPSGNKIRINMDLIESYGEINKNTFSGYNTDFEGLTYLVPAGLEDDVFNYAVKETPKEIDKLILNMK